MTRVWIPILAALAGLIWFVMMPGPVSTVTITQARATPVGQDRFVVTLDIANSGPPVVLTAVFSPSGATVQVMNPGHRDDALTIPGDSKASFAMDGAHIMLTGAAEVTAGGFIPLALIFDGTGEVTTRAQHMGDAAIAAIDHGAGHGVEAVPAPAIRIDMPNGADASGFPVQLTIDNLALVAVPDGTAHVAGEGHAHIYLKGLKLGRLYTDALTLGALPPGGYTLRIALNSHDHRPYLKNGAAVEAVATFTIP